MWKLGEKGEKAKKSQGLSCPRRIWKALTMEDMEGTDYGPSHNHRQSSEEPRTELSDTNSHFV
jgi:hypothetical protein